ncbi:hypothetical protein [Cupriavidus sp. CP313]
MQPTYQTQTFALVSFLLIASTVVAPLAAYLGSHFKQMLGEGEAFEGEQAAHVVSAFLLALLTTVGYCAEAVAPPAWVGGLCVATAYSPVLWMVARAVRSSRTTSTRRPLAAL